MVIKCNYIRADPLRGVFAFDQASPSLSEFASQILIACKPPNGLGKRLGVVRRHKDRVDTRASDFTTAGHIGRDDRSPESGRLQ